VPLHKDLSFVQHRPLVEKELLDILVEQFWASLHFNQRRKLDQLEIAIGYFD
jgi:hypothetical protein